MAGKQSVFIGRFEESINRLSNRIRLHRHTYFEVFAMDGKGSHFNDFKEYSIDGPTMIFVSPGQVHSWPQIERLRGLMICFTQAFFDGDQPPPSPLLSHPYWHPQASSPVLPLTPEGWNSLSPIAREMETEFQQQAREMQPALRSLLKVLFIRADRHFKAEPLSEKWSAGAALARGFRLALEQHFRTMTSVSDYAKLLKTTPDHLSETVGEQFGASAGTLIRNRLLLEAERLLTYTEMNISEIAFSLGFQDPAYFSRFFRRLTGQPPASFRTITREKHQT